MPSRSRLERCCRGSSITARLVIAGLVAAMVIQRPPAACLIAASAASAAFSASAAAEAASSAAFVCAAPFARASAQAGRRLGARISLGEKRVH